MRRYTNSTSKVAKVSSRLSSTFRSPKSRSNASRKNVRRRLLIGRQRTDPVRQFQKPEIAFTVLPLLYGSLESKPEKQRDNRPGKL